MGFKMADLFHRVSIRKFKDEAVSNEDIGYILRQRWQRRPRRISSRGSFM